MNNKKNVNQSMVRGFGLIELMVVLVILVVITALVMPILTDLVNEQRSRVEMERCHEVVMKTASESLMQGVASQVVVAGDTITGELLLDDGTILQIAEHQLMHGVFGRITNNATPILGSTVLTPTNYSSFGHVIPFNGLGILSPNGGPDGAVILFSYQGHVSAIEILQSGLVQTFHHSKGDSTWVQ